MKTSQPLYFGEAGRGLFGLFHAPRGAQQAALGLVICSPAFSEAHSAYFGMRRTAERAAAAGVPTLRFDYCGTGDSSGDDEDTARVAAWLASAHDAIDALRRVSGVRHVCLLGVRLGATLAAMAGGDRDDVSSLIAIAPVVRGRQYVRELRALESLRPNGAGVCEDPAATAVTGGGFVMTAETRAALEAIDLATLGAPPAPQVLLIEPDGLATDERWPQQLGRLGCEVRRERVQGYAEFVQQTPLRSGPGPVMECALAWLEAQAALHPRSPSSRGPVPTGLLRLGPVGAGARQGSELVEAAVTFGTAEPLCGIVTLRRDAASGAGPADCQAMILVGAVTSRVGPNRIYVELARHLAARGMVVLRMDVGGIGESVAAGAENEVYSQRGQQDVAQAARFLQAHYAATQVHALGLCAGAYHVLRAAAAGAPLRSVVSVNQLAFRAARGMTATDPPVETRLVLAAFRLKRLLERGHLQAGLAGSRRSWTKFTSVALLYAGWALGRRCINALSWLGVPMPDDAAMQMRRIAARGATMHFIVSAGSAEQDLLLGYGGSVLGKLCKKAAVSIDAIAGTDHIFSGAADRQRLLDVLDRLYAAPQPSQAAVGPERAPRARGDSVPGSLLGFTSQAQSSQAR